MEREKGKLGEKRSEVKREMVDKSKEKKKKLKKRRKKK